MPGQGVGLVATEMIVERPADDADRRLAELTDQIRPRVQRARTLGELDAMFKTGSIPDPLPDGFLPGRVLAMSVWPAFDAAIRRIADLWMPWKGKSFDRAASTGINIMTRDAKVPLRLLFGYRPERQVGRRMEVFPFRNRVAPGAVDPDLTVYKIDYDFDANPDFIIRRILDEVVEVSKGVYLGKILFRLGARFRPIGYFTLRSTSQGA